MSVILIVMSTAWYIYLALATGRVKPVLAAWVVNGSATVLSFATYMTAPKHSLVSNIYNLASVVTINAILVAAIVIARRTGAKLAFSPFQKKCLWASLAIVLLWVALIALGGTGVIPNVLIQVMMLLGYFVIAERLWRTKVNTESFFAWWCIVSASFAGMVTAGISDDWLAALFAGRTCIGSFVLVLLMYRAEWYMRRS